MALADQVRERLRKLKEQHKYSFSELSKMTGVIPSQLCRFLTGQNLAEKTVRKLAEKLEIRIDDHDQQLIDQLTDVFADEKSAVKRRRNLETLLQAARVLASRSADELAKLTPEKIAKSGKSKKSKSRK